MVKGPDKAPEATRIKFVDAALDGLDLRAEHRVVGGGIHGGSDERRLLRASRIKIR